MKGVETHERQSEGKCNVDRQDSEGSGKLDWKECARSDKLDWKDCERKCNVDRIGMEEGRPEVNIEAGTR